MRREQVVARSQYHARHANRSEIATPSPRPRGDARGGARDIVEGKIRHVGRADATRVDGQYRVLLGEYTRLKSKGGDVGAEARQQDYGIALALAKNLESNPFSRATPYSGGGEKRTRPA
jgi:hypothetical protein